MTITKVFEHAIESSYNVHRRNFSSKQAMIFGEKTKK
jgi:hypothetical protein